MSPRDRRSKEFDQNDSHSEDRLMPAISGSSEGRRVRRINPLGMRVVVRICRESNQTEGGLYLPEGAKQAMLDSVLAEVIEVASAVDSHTDEETNVSGIPLGAIILIPKTAGVRVSWDEYLRIVETRDVLAIVEEIALT